MVAGAGDKENCLDSHRKSGHREKGRDEMAHLRALFIPSQAVDVVDDASTYCVLLIAPEVVKQLRFYNIALALKSHLS